MISFGLGLRSKTQCFFFTNWSSIIFENKDRKHNKRASYVGRIVDIVIDICQQINLYKYSKSFRIVKVHRFSPSTISRNTHESQPIFDFNYFKCVYVLIMCIQINKIKRTLLQSIVWYGYRARMFRWWFHFDTFLKWMIFWLLFCVVLFSWPLFRHLVWLKMDTQAHEHTVILVYRIKISK